MIPDEYFINEYFQQESNTIKTLQESVGEKESELQELIESIDFEDEEDDKENENNDSESRNLKSIKDFLKAQVTELKIRNGNGKELKVMQDSLIKINAIECDLKEYKRARKNVEKELEFKIDLKRYGNHEYKKDYLETLEKAKLELSDIKKLPKHENKKENAALGKKIKSIESDIKILEYRLKNFDKWLKDVRGQITTIECKELILKKHNSLVQDWLGKYLVSEKRKLISCIEKLWDKYAISSQKIENERAKTQNELDRIFQTLKYKQ